jgi:MFS transporter, PAT family, beta-lactamase induction signal transducer AmpG
MDKTEANILQPEPLAPGHEEAAVPAEPEPSGSDRSPWWFVPSLYFMQGVPVVIVQQMSVTMYKKMDVPNDQIGLWTSLIAWPWIVKMLWGPLVENNGTRRSWIVVMQALLIAGLGFVALGIERPAFFGITLAVFFVIAFLSATHDIAADGYYLLALRERQQAFFVGIRSAFFRLAMIFGTGLLVVLAGNLENAGMAIPRTWMIALLVGAGLYAVLFLYNLWALPKPPADVARKPIDIVEVLTRFGQIAFMLVGLFLLGRLIVIAAGAFNEFLTRFGVKMVFTPVDNLTPLFLPTATGHGQGIDPYPFVAQNVLMPFWFQLLISLGVILAVIMSTRHLFDKIGMAPAAKTYFTQERIISILAFILLYRFGESMLAKMATPFLLDPAESGGLGLNTEAVGVIIGTVGIFGLTIGGLAGAWLISKYGIRKVIWPMVIALNGPNLFYVWMAYAKPASPLSIQLQRGEFPFMHIQLASVGSPLLDTIIDKIINIPSQIYNLFALIYHAMIDPVGRLVFIEQTGYGFGFAAYMVYLLYVSQTTKRYQTSHYAISTGLMALGAMIAGIASGYAQQFFARAGVAEGTNPLGYAHFFIFVCILTIPGMITLFFIPLKDPAPAE